MTGSRGISPHSSGSEGHDAPEQPTVQFAIRLCGYSMASSRGGGQAPAAIALLSLPPALLAALRMLKSDGDFFTFIAAHERKGGSNIAACICNVLLYLASNDERS